MAKVRVLECLAISTGTRTKVFRTGRIISKELEPIPGSNKMRDPANFVYRQVAKDLYQATGRRLEVDLNLVKHPVAPSGDGWATF